MKGSVQAAVITGVCTLAVGFLGGKSMVNNNLRISVNGENVKVNNEDVQNLASENQKLKEELSGYKEQIETLTSKNSNLESGLEDATGELDEIPSIKFNNTGLWIDGEEQPIDKNMSLVVLDGKTYLSKDLIDSIAGDGKTITISDDKISIGKVIKEKSPLFKMSIVEDLSSKILDSVTDTYGNSYGKSLLLEYVDKYIVFNANRNYSYFKCRIAARDESRNINGSIQIEADGEVVYSSPTVTATTEPFDVDIPINGASLLKIQTIGKSSKRCNILITNAVLYN